MSAIVRLRDIAREAGCHYSTVSLALRNDPRLPPTTRKRIQQIAARLGYRSNPLISNLISSIKKERTPPELGVLAFLDTRKRPGKQPEISLERDPFYQGARCRAEEFGYRLDPFQLTTPEMSAQRMKAILHARGIRGIVINSSHVPRGHLSFDVSSFACALRGYSQLRPNLYRVSHNHFQGLLLAVHFLRRLGYRRIGMALQQAADTIVNEQWSAGFLSYQQGLPASLRVPLLRPKKWQKEELIRWFRSHSPDAIIGHDCTVTKWLKEADIDVPRQVGFANLDLDQSTEEGQAGIWQNLSEAGAAAVDMVTTQMQRNEFGIPANPRLLLIEGVWRAGITVRSL